MTLKEYELLVSNTNEDDWTRISCWGAGSGPSYLNKFDILENGSGEFESIKIDSHGDYISLKKDLLVSVAWGIRHNDNFIEKWANSFPDSRAVSGFVDFFYSGVLVYRDIYVSVDGGRCSIPLPKRVFNSRENEVEELLITKQRYKFFSLLNDNEYNRYLNESGITIIDGEWMVGDGF